MGDTKHSREWYRGKEWHSARVERAASKRRKKERKKERERSKRDTYVTERYGKVGHGQCGRKVRFKSEHGARVYIERHPRTTPLTCYKCELCGGWHLTSHPELAPTDGGQRVPENTEPEQEMTDEMRMEALASALERRFGSVRRNRELVTEEVAEEYDTFLEGGDVPPMPVA